MSGTTQMRQIMNLLTEDTRAPGISSLPRDTTLHEEIVALGDNLLEMANLPSQKTGIPGTIFISTAMASHGPRVKYFQKPGRNQASFSVTIADEPQLVANSLPAPVARKIAPLVIQWVQVNKEALLQFWHKGDEMMHEEVTNLISNLRPIS